LTTDKFEQASINLEMVPANVEKSLSRIAKNTYFILAIFGGLLTTLIIPVFLHLKGLA
jgi:hypothetical protein